MVGIALRILAGLGSIFEKFSMNDKRDEKCESVVDPRLLY